MATAGRRYISVVLWAFAGWGQQPPPTIAITGTVTDRAGVPVAAAVVELRNAADGTTSRGITDAAGKYTLQSFAPGTYSVKVDADGFALSTTAGLRFLPGTFKSLDVVLDRDIMRAPSEKPLVRSLPLDATTSLPTFLVTCTNLTDAAVSPDRVPTGISLDGVALSQLGDIWLSGSPSRPISAGRWWRLVVELAPTGFRSVALRSPNLGEPAMKIRRPVDLTAGAHRVAFSCGGGWSEELSFTWH